MLEGLAEEHGIDLYQDGAGELQDPEPQIDRAAELQKEWKTELGQLWEIPGKAGVHRVLCGDSTKKEDVGWLMNGTETPLMATDPPYGVDYAGGKYNPRAKDWDGIEGDKRQGDDLTVWMRAVMGRWLPFMSADAVFYIWTAPMQEGAAAAAALGMAGLHIQSQIIWVKNQFALGQADYQWKHEPCWYGYREGQKHRWFGGRDQDTVWEVSKIANANYKHPHEKPTELYARPIRNHTRVGETICDPFLGSGTSIVACEQLGRVGYGIEISPAYVAVTLQRLKDMGLEPRLAEPAN